MRVLEELKQKRGLPRQISTSMAVQPKIGQLLP